MEWGVVAEHGFPLAGCVAVIAWLLKDRAALIAEIRSERDSNSELQQQMLAIHEKYAAEKERAATAYQAWAERQSDRMHSFAKTTESVVAFTERVDEALRERLVDAHRAYRRRRESDRATPRS